MKGPDCHALGRRHECWHLHDTGIVGRVRMNDVEARLVEQALELAKHPRMKGVQGLGAVAEQGKGLPYPDDLERNILVGRTFHGYQAS